MRWVKKFRRSGSSFSRFPPQFLSPFPPFLSGDTAAASGVRMLMESRKRNPEEEGRRKGNKHGNLRGSGEHDNARRRERDPGTEEGKRKRGSEGESHSGGNTAREREREAEAAEKGGLKI